MSDDLKGREASLVGVSQTNILQRRCDGMKKTYVCDTSVLIHSPDSILKFEDNVIVIPLVVLDEIAGIRKDPGERGQAAREFQRLLDSLHTNGGNLHDGISLPGGGKLVVQLEPDHLPVKPRNADNVIIATAYHLSKNGKGFPKPTVVVSNDFGLRFRAEALGLKAEEYRNDKVSIPDQYGKIFHEGETPPDIRSVRYMVSSSGARIFRLSEDDKMTEIRRGRSVYGLTPRNVYQECAFDACLSDLVDLVVLSGRSGSGKTIISVASGLHLVERTNRNRHNAAAMTMIRPCDSLFVTRPTVPVGQYDIGALPGEKESKLHPWLQPVFDSLEVLFDSKKQEKDGRDVKYKPYEYLLDKGMLELESLGFLRGRSLRNRFILLEEMQNGRKIDALTAVTRAGENSKVVITGDPNQIDAYYLPKNATALNHVISRMIQEPNFCYLSLPDTARSRLAEQGARLLQ